jgi:hypothetical protein
VPHVQRVASSGGVKVIAGIVGDKPVVGLIVDALERRHRAELVPLGGVVVDDVEDDFDPGLVQRFHHVLEFGGDLPAAPRRVLAVRGEEPDRVVAPVVPEPAVDEHVVLDEIVDRHQLDRSDAQAGQVLDGLGMRQPGVGAPQVVGDAGVPHGEPFDVASVQHGLVPRGAQQMIIAPAEPRVGDDRLRHVRRAVGVIALAVVPGERVAVDGLVPPDLAVDLHGVRIKEQLRRLAPQPPAGIMRAVHPVAVPLASADARQEAVPHIPVRLGQADPPLPAGAVVEQAQFGALRDLGEQREVRPDPVVGRAKRVRPPWPHFHNPHPIP